MAKRKHTVEEIIRKLREVEIALGRGQALAEAVRQIGVTEHTYYRWRKQYGGIRVDEARRLKDLERENVRLKRLVADQALDISILKEAASGNS
jgi:transposase-like protein